jgi:hypothetical protein
VLRATKQSKETMMHLWRLFTIISFIVVERLEGFLVGGRSRRSRCFLPSVSRACRPPASSALFSSQPSSEETEAALKEEEESTESIPTDLTPHQLDFVCGYMNKHHSDVLRAWAEAFSSLGTEMAKANVMSGGSFRIESAELTNIIDLKEVQLEVVVQRRNKPKEARAVSFSINTVPIPQRARYYGKQDVVPDDEARLPIDDVLRRFCRLAWMVEMPAVTGKLIQLAIQLEGAGVGKLPENLYVCRVKNSTIDISFSLTCRFLLFLKTLRIQIFEPGAAQSLRASMVLRQGCRSSSRCCGVVFAR